jgi:hypothetical protein
MLLIGDLRMLAHLMALLHRYKESSTVIRKNYYFLDICKACLSLCKFFLSLLKLKSIMAAKVFTKVLYYQKFIGILLIVIGLPMSIISKSPESAKMLIFGLFILFTSWDKIMDERLLSLKMTSIYFAIIVSYSFKMISSELVKQQIFSYELTSINHFIIMVFAVANVTYYSRLYFSTNKGDD